jgi:hypothetical protein
MATVNLNFVISEMQENNFLYWKIKDKSNIIAIQDDESADLDHSIATLKKKLQAISANVVTIEVSQKSTKAKNKGGDNTTTGRTYIVTLDNNTPAPIEGRAIVNVQGLEELKQLRKENENLKLQAIENKYEQVINGLNKKFEEFSNKKNDPFEQVITALLTNYMQGMQGSANPANINGHQNKELPNWLILAQRWEEADETASELMEKIVILAETDKFTYNAAKAKLLSI